MQVNESQPNVEVDLGSLKPSEDALALEINAYIKLAAEFNLFAVLLKESSADEMYFLSLADKFADKVTALESEIESNPSSIRAYKEG